MDRLFAKSLNTPDQAPSESIYLPGHLEDAIICAQAIVDATGLHQLRSFGLSDDLFPRFKMLATLCAACHDLGKANSQFLRMVTSPPGVKTAKQAIRHEWVSWYLLHDPQIRGLIQENIPASTREVDWHMLLWSITGHHPKFKRCIPTERPAGSDDQMILYCSHPDFNECLRLIAAVLQASASSFHLENKTIFVTKEILKSIRRTLADYSISWNGWQYQVETSGLLAALKNTLVCADVAASVLGAQAPSLRSHAQWRSKITESLSVFPTQADLSRLIEDRLTSNGIKRELRKFQKEVAANSEQVTLVKAGCGSGKTLAAYHWARERCPGKRIYFCYPTTGTATEGFRDYLFDQSEHLPKSGAELFHGRSAIDRDVILQVREDEVEEDLIKESDSLSRIRSFRGWGTPLVSCTVDTVLGIINNQSRAIYSWPGICGAAFIFDEIHAYDTSMFSSLLAFLYRLRGVPVLLMTASLPKEREEKLRMILEDRKLAIIPGPQELEELPRYCRQHASLEQTVDLVKQELAQHGKVLWVSNTVRRTVNSFQLCSSFASAFETVYHSRFKYIDRVKRHNALIQSFGQDGAAIAWASQVAEMSLDLSCTLLVTELAPIPALIQRLGRLNRRANDSSYPTRPFIVIDPVDQDGKLSSSPYEEHELEEARDWLAKLPAKITQKDLVDTWESMISTRKDTSVNESTWVDGGFHRDVKELRESNQSMSVILQSDVKRVLSGNARFAEVTIPMNYTSLASELPRFQGAVIVSSDQLQYSELLGAEWK